MPVAATLRHSRSERRLPCGALVELRRLALVWVALVLLVSGRASAEVTAQLSASATRIEVGQPLTVELKVTSDEGSPDSPRLALPKGFGLRGPSVSRGFSATLRGLTPHTRSTMGATWQITPPAVGVYTVGPAQAFVEGRAVSSNTISVEVVTPGTLPQAPPQRRGPRSLLDDDFPFPGFPGFGRPGRSLLDDLMAPPEDAFEPAPPEYQVSGSRDPRAFLEATVTPQRAVLGQRVILRVIAYGGAGVFGEGSSQEPRRPDFFSESLMKPSNRQHMYAAKVGSREYLAVKVREFALYPLKAGKLEIGPMKFTFEGNGYGRSGTERSSQTISVDVTEPPATSRPLDYQLGDVGQFQLQASVNPRTLKEGESFAVVAELSGEGRFPEALRVPEQTGLDWLKPTITDDAHSTPHGRVEAKRTFTYVVKATRAGKVDLGNLRLPYFNPETGKYDVASAALGQVLVDATQPPATQSSAPASGTSQGMAEPDVHLKDLASPRHDLRPFTRNSHWTRAAWVWPTLLGMPLGVFGVQVLGARISGFVQRRRARRQTLSGRAADELKRAQSLNDQGNLEGALTAMERAVFLAIEDATGIKARAILRAELSRALTEAGVETAVAAQSVQLLTEIETVRFARQGDPSTLLSNVKSLLAALPQGTRRTVSVGGRS